MILLAYILLFIKYIFIILIISYVSAFIKFFIAKISILKNSKMLNKSLLRSTIFEALVILLLTIPFFIKINQISIQNRYMLEKLISMSNTKAIKFFQMIIDNSSDYFLFFSNLYATIPFYFLISLSLFTIVLITKNGFKIFYSMPRNYISIFLLSTITPLIIISINFYYSYTLNSYDHKRLSELFTLAIERYYSPDLINSFILEGADVNTKKLQYQFGQFGKGDWSVLMLACRHPKLKTVELLLKNGADPNYTGKYKRTALMFASNDNKVASKLIEYGAHVNAGNILNETSLMIAAICGNFKTVKLLIDNGADVKSQNTEGKTALMFAEKRFFEINKYAKNFAKDKLKSESPHTYTILKEQQEIINYLKQFE